MKDFRASSAYRLVHTALQIEPPSMIARSVLDALADVPTMTPARLQGIELIVQKELAKVHHDIAQDMLCIPLYSPFVGAGADAQQPLAAQEREGLWLLLVDICKRIVLNRVADLQGIVDAAGTGADDLENWDAVPAIEEEPQDGEQ